MCGRGCGRKHRLNPLRLRNFLLHQTVTHALYNACIIPIRKNKITRRRAEDSTPSTARRDNAVRLFFRMGIIQINRRANRTRSIHATPQTTKHFPSRQARFQCPPSQTRAPRQTGAGRIRPLSTAFAMPVGIPQILFQSNRLRQMPGGLMFTAKKRQTYYLHPQVWFTGRKPQTTRIGACRLKSKFP